MASAASFRSILGVQPSTASTGDSTLVIIDAQNEYASGKLRVSGVETSRAVIASVLQKYRAAKAPVIHVVHKTPTGAPVFTPGTELAKEFDELTPLEGESLVVKEHPGSFTGTNLQDLLSATGRSKVALAGYMVSYCSFRAFRAGLPTERIRWSDQMYYRHMSVSAPQLVKLPRGDGTLLPSKMQSAPGTSPARPQKS
jgi:nicotinamidase-related amidase